MVKKKITKNKISRDEAELKHGEKIVTIAENVWGWGSPAGRLRAERRAKLLIDSAMMHRDQEVLELGCGIGIFTDWFVKKGVNISAIDLSSHLLIQAEKRVSGAKFSLADAENLPFDNESFDAIVGSSILHHLDLSLALPEIFRVLRKGGRIAFAEPNMLNPQIAIERSTPFTRHFFNATPQETAFYRWRITKALKMAGFVKVKAQPYGFLHPAVPSKLIKLVQRLENILESLPLISQIAGSLIISAGKL